MIDRVIKRLLSHSPHFVEISYRIKYNYGAAIALQKSRCTTFENRISMCYTFLNEDIRENS